MIGASDGKRCGIDTQEYNGWPNIFTWQVYTCLSSYIETYDTARAIVDESASSYEAAEALREWVQVMRDEWVDRLGKRSDGVCNALFVGVMNNAFQQVNWDHLAKAFDES